MEVIVAQKRTGLFGGLYRVLQGGAWCSSEGGILVTRKYFAQPRNALNSMGFRIACRK